MNEELRRAASWYLEADWPSLLCPHCRQGHLAKVELINRCTASSVDHGDDPNWEPDWRFGYFYGYLRCQHKSCHEYVVVTGEMKVDTITDSQGHWFGEWGTWHRLRFAIPPLLLVVPPAGCPSDVVRSIEDASALLWVDPNAAANRLRHAIEELLTALKIRKLTRTRQPLKTHDRIMKLRQRNNVNDAVVADTLEAVKWIGNQGSHEGSLVESDVIDGAECLQYALFLLYDKTGENVAKRVRKINARKGLPHRRKSK